MMGALLLALSLGTGLAMACPAVLASPVIGSNPDAPVNRDDPEQADGNKSVVSTAEGSAVVVTANPEASSAALTMLREGGHAVDAVVAAQAVLAVVEPQSSGLAGGGFLLNWNAEQASLEVLDGRETAPGSSREDDLMTSDGKPISWRDATRRFAAIGIPGTVALLWEAHQQDGRLPWSRVLEPAIQLARDGFQPSPRLRQSIRLAQRLGVDHSPAFQALYLPGGQPPASGRIFRNPALADTLTLLAKEGGPGFYRGTLAARILDDMATLASREPTVQGWTRADLASYSVVRRSPLCLSLQVYRLCSVPPPSSGGLALLQTLALFTESGERSGPGHVGSWHRLGQAMQWADADRLYWVHDPIDGAVPSAALLDPGYISTRSRDMEQSMGATPQPGLPPGVAQYPFAIPSTGGEQGTTHVSVVDRQGNIASYTSSVETVFGSRHLVAGMVMNNQLTDFSFLPSIDGRPVANRRRPGRRPMSSMAPVIVFQDDQPMLAAGTPGGRTIPHYLARVLVASLIWNLPPDQAVALPHLSMRRGSLVLERDAPLPWPVSPSELSDPDQTPRQQRFGSGTGLLQKINNRWVGAADPRREGKALALP